MSYVGQSMKRFEDPRLVTGNGAFVGDLTLPDMLHAAVLRLIRVGFGRAGVATVADAVAIGIDMVADAGRALGAVALPSR